MLVVELGFFAEFFPFVLALVGTDWVVYEIGDFILEVLVVLLHTLLEGVV